MTSSFRIDSRSAPRLLTKEGAKPEEWRNVCSFFATLFRWLWPDAANVVDDLPDLLLCELLLVSQHVGRDAVANDDEDFAIGRTVIPGVVGQVGRLAA